MRGPTIPKQYWEKGLSKHLFVRLAQERFFHINDLWRKYNPGIVRVSFWNRLFNFFKNLLTILWRQKKQVN